MTIPPAISPDGAYWWDGAAWQPMSQEQQEDEPEDEPEAVQDQAPGPPPEAEGIPEAQTIPAAVPIQPTMPLPRAQLIPPVWAVQPAQAMPALQPVPESPVAPAIAASKQMVPWATAHQAKQAKPADFSWLPDDLDLPATRPVEPSSKILETAPPVSTIPPPSWQARKPRLPGRRTVLIALVAILAVGAVGEGVLALRQYGLPKAAVAASPSPQATPSPTASPTPSPLAGPLTAQIAGSACPVVHVGDPACLKVTFTNTGPPITKLAMLFDTDKPHTDWFEHHTGASLAKTDPSAGCDFDLVKLEVVCGPVPTGGHLNIVLTGFVASPGTFQYGVRFGDVHAGFFSDVNLNSDGTPFVMFWSEVAK